MCHLVARHSKWNTENMFQLDCNQPQKRDLNELILSITIQECGYCQKITDREWRASGLRKLA